MAEPPRGPRAAWQAHDDGAGVVAAGGGDGGGGDATTGSSKLGGTHGGLPKGTAAVVQTGAAGEGARGSSSGAGSSSPVG